ncbi:biotin-dependent carboxyltransferase family protein [Hoyosella sp. G463]|uniref:Biotin-dependent carboxyltransferase family protein n=1 Tax=Lolliginicoccus lacisalsi TaxID=2742202 RepID=A0A927PM16_9ACTN|nr:biotin-dependent carboxyltransferase family protein [Lolliginicoccus lacisalsi]MBD8505926.1 biotin-dependent carboxyltransferase family protein [Lolliginicoccus lacisalsi]
MTAVLEITATGPLALLEDEGRPGYAAQGVTWSGAADLGAYRAANRLVGNQPGMPCIEITLGGFEARALHAVCCAVTGAAAAIRINGRAHAAHHLLWLEPGDHLAVEAPVAGCRSYLAARGGFRGDRALGSCSTDTLSGLGPPPLQPGDLLELGEGRDRWPAATSLPPLIVPPRAGPVELPVLRGPRHDWFAPEAWTLLCGSMFEVTDEASRVGVRLAGPRPLERAGEQEIPSEGMVPGAIQVPPSGKPVVFLRDHPVTGGYPVIGVVIDSDAVGQLRPGDQVLFRAVAGRQHQSGSSGDELVEHAP